MILNDLQVIYECVLRYGILNLVVENFILLNSFETIKEYNGFLVEV